MNYSDKCAFLTDIKLAQPNKFLALWDKANEFLNPEEIKRLQKFQMNPSLMTKVLDQKK